MRTLKLKVLLPGAFKILKVNPLSSTEVRFLKTCTLITIVIYVQILRICTLVELKELTFKILKPHEGEFGASKYEFYLNQYTNASF